MDIPNTQSPPPPDTNRAPVSFIDFQQQNGVAWDIINEALNEYDAFMLDDDYDAQRALNNIMLKMRDRRDAYNPLSTKPK